MIFIARNDNSWLSRWWWTIDHWNLIQMLTLAIIGSIMILAAGSAVAIRNNLPELYFFIHHICYLIISISAMIFTTFLSSKGIIRLSIIGFIICFLLLILVMIIGPDIKGASRWLIIGGFSIQPSEFIKPFFVIVTAYLISNQYKTIKFLPSIITRLHISLLLLLGILLFLLKQPDLGMSVIIILIWSGQLFLAGISLDGFSYYLVY